MNNFYRKILIPLFFLSTSLFAMEKKTPLATQKIPKPKKIAFDVLGQYEAQEMTLEDKIADAKKNIENYKKSLSPSKVKDSLAAYQEILQELQAQKHIQDQTKQAPRSSELLLAPEAQQPTPSKLAKTSSQQRIDSIKVPADLTSLFPESQLTLEQQNKQAIDQIKITYTKKFKEAQSESDRQAILEELKSNLASDQSSTINKQAYSEILAIVEPEETALEALGNIVLEITRPIAENVAPAVKATISGGQYIGTQVESIKKQALSAAGKMATALSDSIKQNKSLKKVSIRTKTDAFECTNGIIPDNISQKSTISTSSAPQKPLKIGSFGLVVTIIKMIPSNAQKIMQTPQGAKKLISYIAESVSRMLGYPGKITLTMEKVINEAVAEIEGPDGFSSEEDPIKFSKKMKVFVGNLVPKLIKSITKKDPRLINVFEIPAKQGDLLPVNVKITYNEGDKSIKAVVVTYDNNSYNIDPQACTVEKDQITISTALYQKSQIKPSQLSKILQTKLKSLGDAIIENKKYDDTTIQNTVKSWVDYVYPKITDPISDGQITIQLSAPDKNNQRTIIKKTITKKQDDLSFKTETLDAQHNQTVELTGIIGDRFSPKIAIKFDQSGTLNSVNMEHNLLHTSRNKLIITDFKPVAQRVSYDESDDTFTVVTDFPPDEVDSLGKAMKRVLDAGVDAITTAILHGIMESPGLQNARVIDPNMASALNQTQKLVTAATEVRIESVITTINQKTHKIQTYTIKIMSDNSRTVTRLSYPMDKDLSLQGPTIEIPDDTDSIDVNFIDGLFSKRQQDSKLLTGKPNYLQSDETN